MERRLTRPEKRDKMRDAQAMRIVQLKTLENLDKIFQSDTCND